MMQEEIEMKIGKEQIDRIPELPHWYAKDCAKSFAIGAGLGMFIAWLLAHC
jgi:hypothetical protein